MESDIGVCDGRFRNSRVVVGRVRTNEHKAKYQIGISDLKNLIDCFHKSLLISVYRRSTSTRNGSSPEYWLDDVAGYLLKPQWVGHKCGPAISIHPAPRPTFRMLLRCRVLSNDIKLGKLLQGERTAVSSWLAGENTVVVFAPHLSKRSRPDQLLISY